MKVVLVKEKGVWTVTKVEYGEKEIPLTPKDVTLIERTLRLRSRGEIRSYNERAKKLVAQGVTNG